MTFGKLTASSAMMLAAALASGMLVKILTASRKVLQTKSANR